MPRLLNRRCSSRRDPSHLRICDRFRAVAEAHLTASMASGAVAEVARGQRQRTGSPRQNRIGRNRPQSRRSHPRSWMSAPSALRSCGHYSGGGSKRRGQAPRSIPRQMPKCAPDRLPSRIPPTAKFPRPVPAPASRAGRTARFRGQDAILASCQPFLMRRRIFSRAVSGSSPQAIVPEKLPSGRSRYTVAVWSMV